METWYTHIFFFSGVFILHQMKHKPWQNDCSQRRSRSACTSTQSDQILRCALHGLLATRAFFTRETMALISDCTDAQTELCLCLVHRPVFVLSCSSRNSPFLIIESFVVDPSDEGFKIEHERFECGVCNNTSRLKSNVRRHECRHLTEGNGPPGVDERISILCDQCARPFKTNCGLIFFVHTKHLKTLRFKCSVCPNLM